MYMTLRDIRFPVKKAEIGSYVNSPYSLDRYGQLIPPALRWTLDVDMEDSPLLDSTIAPRLWCDLLSIPMRHWTELEGKSLDLSEPYDDDIGPRAYSYFGGHDPIPQSLLTFGKREGRNFSIRWEGFCSPFWEKPFDEDVPFVVEAQASLDYLCVGGSDKDTPQTARERLSHFLDPDDFIQLPRKEVTPYIFNFVFEQKELGR